MCYAFDEKSGKSELRILIATSWLINMEKRKYPREFLLAELKRIANLLGKIPTMEEFDKESKIAAVTLAKRFGGWKPALFRRAGACRLGADRAGRDA